MVYLGIQTLRSEIAVDGTVFLGLGAKVALRP
jgi:hypothetical protein